MKILCVANQKGGVGKSTLAAHLAYAALDIDKKVLLIDMQDHGSLSLSFVPEKRVETNSVASDLFFSKELIEPELIKKNLSIVRSDVNLLLAEKANNEAVNRPKQALNKLSAAYDLCLIDTPPLLGIRLAASLVASDFVITPVNIGLYELDGLSALLSTINSVRNNGLNAALTYLGILLMKTNSRSIEEKEALILLRKRYGNLILPFELPQRAAVKRAVSARVPVWRNTSGSSHLKAASEWKEATQGILKLIFS